MLKLNNLEEGEMKELNIKERICKIPVDDLKSYLERELSTKHSQELEKSNIEFEFDLWNSLINKRAIDGRLTLIYEDQRYCKDLLLDSSLILSQALSICSTDFERVLRKIESKKRKLQGQANREAKIKDLETQFFQTEDDLKEFIKLLHSMLIDLGIGNHLVFEEIQSKYNLEKLCTNPMKELSHNSTIILSQFKIQFDIEDKSTLNFYIYLTNEKDLEFKYGRHSNYGSNTNIAIPIPDFKSLPEREVLFNSYVRVIHETLRQKYRKLLNESA